MMFHPEDLDGINQERLLASFVPTLNLSENESDAGDVSWYNIIFRNTNKFNLVAKYLAAGLLLHRVAHVMVNTKELIRIGSIGLCYEGIVS